MWASLRVFDFEHDGERGHANRSGAEGQQDFDRSVAAPAAIGPGREIARCPVAEPLAFALLAVVADEGEDDGNGDSNEYKAADHHQKPVDIAASREAPDGDGKPGGGAKAK